MKYALLIGCNYAKTDSALAGCINDVLRSKEYLLSHGFNKSDIVLLTDDPAITPATMIPTRTNILKSIDECVAKLHSGDLLFFHMSSHGGSVKDTNGDEKDGNDETVYGADLKEIKDDEIKDKLVNRIPKGAKLRAVMDNCHSATNMDLPWEFKYANAYQRQSTPCSLSDDILCIAGCADDDFSADTVDSSGKPSGALSMTVFGILDAAHKDLTWRDLLAMVRHELKKNGYEQVPQLAMGRKKLEKTMVDL